MSDQDQTHSKERCDDGQALDNRGALQHRAWLVLRLQQALVVPHGRQRDKVRLYTWAVSLSASFGAGAAEGGRLTTIRSSEPTLKPSWSVKERACMQVLEHSSHSSLRLTGVEIMSHFVETAWYAPARCSSTVAPPGSVTVAKPASQAAPAAA